jgi:hypothetical protein
MPTPKDGYFDKAGTRVPGTTTIIGRFKNSSALMFWAFKQGKSGARTLYEKAEEAAEIGTVAHGMVEMHIKGCSDKDIQIYLEDALIDPGMCAKAATAFASYRSWIKNFSVQIVEQEIQLVSEKYKYGGTPDAVGMIGNQLVLLDWKTSNAVYSDYLIQLAAYMNLWNENYPDKPITGGAHLLRFSKEHGDFAHHYYDNLDDEWEQFKDFRKCYERDKRIEKRAA